MCVSVCLCVCICVCVCLCMCAGVCLCVVGYVCVHACVFNSSSHWNPVITFDQLTYRDSPACFGNSPKDLVSESSLFSLLTRGTVWSRNPELFTNRTASILHTLSITSSWTHKKQRRTRSQLHQTSYNLLDSAKNLKARQQREDGHRGSHRQGHRHQNKSSFYCRLPVVAEAVLCDWHQG